MIRSLFSGVSGMKSHQIRMDVIGNNIANVNTVGFKSGRVNFEDTLYQTIKSSSKNTNPAQAGLGTSIASITSDMNSGGLQSTGRTLDLAINGDGFFRFTDPQKGFEDQSNSLYGREGTLYINDNGSIVNSNGLQLVTYQWNKATTNDPNDPTTLVPFEQSAGTITLQRVKVDPNTRQPVDGDVAADPTLITSTPQIPINITADMDIDDVINTINDQTSLTGVAASKTTDINGDECMVLSSDANSLDGFYIVNDTRTGGAFTPDKVYQYDSDSYGQRALRIDQSDIPIGSISFMDDGTVTGYNQEGENLEWVGDTVDPVTGQLSRYDSTMVKLYTFPNQDGLERVDKNIYTESVSSGSEQEGVAGSTGYGSIASGYLEMSNVDLTDEFSNMITTQRGYQANARMITVSDTMLEELLNLKR